jgi:hypothetical protein
MKFLHFFYDGVIFVLLNPYPHPDPVGQNECGSGSSTLSFYLYFLSLDHASTIYYALYYLNLINDPIRTLEDNLLGLVPVAPSHGALDPPVVPAIDVGENSKTRHKNNI